MSYVELLPVGEVTFTRVSTGWRAVVTRHDVVFVASGSSPSWAYFALLGVLGYTEKAVLVDKEDA